MYPLFMLTNSGKIFNMNYESFFFFNLRKRFFFMSLHIALGPLLLKLILHILHLYLVHDSRLVKAQWIVLELPLDLSDVLPNPTTLIIIDEVKGLEEVPSHGSLVHHLFLIAHDKPILCGGRALFNSCR